MGSYATQSDLSSQLSSKANRSDLAELEQKVTANTTAIEGKATQDQIDDIKVGLAKKQDKIKVNSVDVTNLTHANIDQLINIVQELLIALDSSGLIIMEDGLE